MKHLLKLGDLSREDILSILNLADQLKFERNNGIQKDYLKGKKLGMIFQKASTRTRVSFEVGMYELGGYALFLSSNDLQIGRGEPVKDTARVLSRYLDGIMIRTFAQQEVEDLAKYGSIPIINGLTDYCHPCQVLADLMTIREYKGTFKGLKMAFVGDGNNMANSLIVGAVKTGMSFTVACPKGYEPDAELVKWGKESGLLTVTSDVEEAISGADVLYTDVWVSFEVGMYELGGYALFLSSNDLQIGRGEPVKDTARVLSRYLDGIMIRTFAQQEVEDLAKYGSIPIINGLTDYCHPCQVLADLMTIREYKGTFKGLKMAFVGDGNNMANSLIVGAVKTGMSFTVACPKGYEPDAELVKWGKESGLLTVTSDVEEAISGADVLYTDVWASMGQEKEKAERENAFKGFQINEKNIKAAKDDVMVMHCLPAHRGEEITDGVLEAHAKEIFDEAENRLHAQKAVMVKLMR